MATARRTDEHPYASFLDRVQKPAQYLGGEQGEVRKPWTAETTSLCLAFPDLYEIGMSHLGYKILYELINKEPDLVAERAYAVWHDMEAELRAHDQRLLSLESRKPLHAFDVVGFSLQYELTYTNILQMIELGGIPLRTADRKDEHPLIIAGGPTATHGESLSRFIDAFLIGDGEVQTAEIMRTWKRLSERGAPREERLRALARLDGVYVPSLYETRLDPDTGFHVVQEPQDDVPFPVQRTIVPDLEPYPFPSDGPVATVETIFDRVSVEVARGCTEGCRFCQAGMIYRPVRERSPKSILKVIHDAVDQGGYDEASLTSLSTADYSAIAPLVHEAVNTLQEKRVSLSVSSLRAYGLSENVLDDMKRQRAGGLTFAPEAGTQRMRDVVNKNVTEAQLMETAERIFSRGWNNMKLYFMIGLPTEEDEDVLGIIDTGAKALDKAREVQGNKRGRVTVSVSTHVPKPHTPFQWCAMDTVETIHRKQQLLRDAVRRTRVNLRMHDSRGSWLEGVLARGDRRLGAVIETAYTNGARFDSWDEQLDLDAWDDAFEEHDIEPRAFLGTLPVDARLPWDHIDVSLEPGFLAREYRRALRNRLSPPCGKAVGDFVHHTNVADASGDTRRLVCYNCGVACDMTKMRDERIDALVQLGAHQPRPNRTAARAHEPATQTTNAEPQRIAAITDRRPLIQVDQGKPTRVRLAFEKLGPFAYRSHLDLVRLFPRLLRQLKLPLYYSIGFHPKPQIVFGPALAVGTASFGEYVDIKLREDALQPDTLDDIVERLNAIAPEGLRFIDAVRLGDHDKAINKIVTEARYVAAFPVSALRDLGFADSDSLYDVVRRRAAGRLQVTRETKRGVKTVDVAAGLRDLRTVAGFDEIERAGLQGDFAAISFRVVLGEQITPRPIEVVQALSGLAEPPVRFIRLGLFGQTGGEARPPIDLKAFRRVPTKLRVAQRPDAKAVGA